MDFIKEDLDFKKILMRRYKSYHLNEQDVCVIFLIDELNKGVPHHIKAEELEPFMTINTKEIDAIMSKIVKLGYLVIDNKKHCLSLAPLKTKIFNDTIRDVYVHEAELKTFNDSSELYQLVIDAIKRPISPVEYDTVNSWVIRKITKEDVSSAIARVKERKRSVTIAALNKELKIDKLNKETIIDENSKELLKDLDKDLYND